MKPNWSRIKELYEAGESGRRISEQMKEAGQPISHVAINNRAKKEGWRKPEGDNPVTAAESYLSLPESEMHQPVMFNKDTPQVRADILTDVEQGLSLTLAAQRAGISPDSIARWKKGDPVFAAKIARAQANRAKRRIQRIESAGDRGDWKADAWLIERSEETKGDFGGGSSNGPTINVQINVPVPTPVTIDGESV